MESEGSSAILDLKDDEIGTDDGSIEHIAVQSHYVDEPPPLIMEHGYDIAVKVDAPMKQLSTLETFVTYRVRCVCARWTAPPYVRRRYNHFKVLHRRLTAAHPLLPVPPLPPLHSPWQQLDRYDPAFVAIRTLALDSFLGRVVKHPILTHSEDLKLFLTLSDDGLDRTFKTESGALSLWGLTAALYGTGDAKANNGSRVIDPEFSSAADYLQSLQQKLTTLCGLTAKLYKDSAELGNELIGMERACSAWCTLEGKARAVCAGAARAGAARAQRQRCHNAKATLPLLATYCAVVHSKIRERDAMHAAHVAGNGTDSLHNRLEQASESLRSELVDWNVKTRAEIKSFLIDLAENQVKIHQENLMAWEHAYKLQTDTDAKDIFKTVSKIAVQNLSPSKCKADITPTETERDLDDFDIDKCSVDSFQIDRPRCDSPKADSCDDSCQADKLKCQSDGTKFDNTDQYRDGCNSSENSRIDKPKQTDGSRIDNCHGGSQIDNCQNDSCQIDSRQSEGSDLEVKSVLSDPLSEFAEVDLSRDS